jgi:putative transcriptional regulator
MMAFLTCRASVEQLSDYLDGHLGPWARFKVWAHLLFCPACRALLATLKAVGPLAAGAERPREAPPEALAALEGALQAVAAGIPPAIPPGALGLLEEGPTDLPLALLAEAHRSLARRGVPASGPYPIPAEVLGQLPPDSQWRWEERDDGTRMAGLVEDPARGARLLLYRCPGGGRSAPHRHLGSESVLVLAGSLNDGGRTLRPGDWVHQAPDSVHAPEAGEEVCWCLLRLDGPVQFL